MKPNFLGFWKHLMALVAASKSWIIKAPKNGTFTTVICLCKKGIEIKISLGVHLKKENNIYPETLKINRKQQKEHKKNIHANDGKHWRSLQIRVKEELTTLNALHWIELYYYTQLSVILTLSYFNFWLFWDASLSYFKIIVELVSSPLLNTWQ